MMPSCRSWIAAAAGVWVAAMLLAGCTGAQSALAPSGRDATSIAALFWWMTGGALLIWIFVVALALRYAFRARGERSRRRDRWLIIGGGVVFPTMTLTVLLIYGLAMIPAAVERAPAGSLVVAVTGEQWWWRVRYMRPDGSQAVLANEVRLPVNEPVQFVLESDNVIHSFWIPPLAGKMDMIPGRVTYLTVRPTRTGIFRGACAEYCGTSHALMAFYVEVMEKPAFEAWLQQQASPAAPITAAGTQRGADVFFANGCAACHTIRGTRAAGEIGPDLTHVGNRLSIGAGVLPNRPDQFLRWVAQTEDVKPGVHMPAFGMLPPADLEALAAFLEALK